MTTNTIIAEVVKIILKHAKPTRIYLYGSRNGGEATETSDIDIAYEDPEYRDFEAIESDIEELTTLLKIDVKNLAFTEERFRSRVISTGRVLYSADKKLRFEDALYNLKRSLERLESAMSSRESLFKEGFSEFYLDIMVKRFEFTYEMSWKSIKRYLAFNGIDSTSPRSCFKEAYAMGIIADESVWLSMIEDRNLTSHIYSEEETRGILDRIDDYVAAFGGLAKELNARLEREG